jgi:hypothetical protein
VTTHEILVKARALIEDPRDWCAEGWGPADRRCSLHAVYKVVTGREWQTEAADMDQPDYVRAAYALSAVCGFSMGHFNDSHTHAEVMAVWDEAIRRHAPEPDTSFLNEVEVEEPVAS